MYILEYDLIAIANEKNKSPVKIVEELLSTGIIVDGAIWLSDCDLSVDFPSDPLWYVVLYSTILGPEFIDEATGIANDHIFRIERDELVDIDIIQFNLISKKVELISSDISLETQDNNMINQDIGKHAHESSHDLAEKTEAGDFRQALQTN